MRMSDWSSDVCSSDLVVGAGHDVVQCPEGLEAGGRGEAGAVEHVFVREGQHGSPQLVLDDASHDRVSLGGRSEEHTSELQSLMRISYAVFCLKKKNTKHGKNITHKKEMRQ